MANLLKGQLVGRFRALKAQRDKLAARHTSELKRLDARLLKIWALIWTDLAERHPTTTTGQSRAMLKAAGVSLDGWRLLGYSAGRALGGEQMTQTRGDFPALYDNVKKPKPKPRPTKKGK